MRKIVIDMDPEDLIKALLIVYGRKLTVGSEKEHAKIEFFTDEGFVLVGEIRLIIQYDER